MSQDDKIKHLLEGMDDVYELEAASVIELVVTLLQIVLAFVGPQKAKALIDRETALAANATAEEIERKRFGN